MKPIIIVIQEKDKITLTEEELTKYILQAYEQGFEDGKTTKVQNISYRDTYDNKISKPTVMFEK